MMALLAPAMILSGSAKWITHTAWSKTLPSAGKSPMMVFTHPPVSSTILSAGRVARVDAAVWAASASEIRRRV
eukprot:CAMPEP_0206246228 /NCGR_PEP_ID=MMETSP0047_2-20121206/19137_1 /ASSEMBLY_ACC=CAM_ASM_000192 /TAXON_ID=195065 /ORGANISM="Chroomonas mesostigmatica_cf, Strain CCMP1168" /LENGTH=72 /DNA_ID=CAMNT_0053671617 /DNA_START=376 /DNA_END=591 /DNA_ORIENTATION=+